MDRQQIKKDTQGKSGVYSIWSDGECIYAGSSVNLWLRIRPWFSNEWKKQSVDRFKLDCQITTIKYAFYPVCCLNSQERKLILELKPKLNHGMPIDKCHKCDIL